MQWALVNDQNIVTNILLYTGEFPASAPDDRNWLQVNDWIKLGDIFDSPEPAIPNNDLVKEQIKVLEDSVTSRMIQETLSGSVLTGLGINKSQNAAEYITSIRAQIATLRSQLT